MFYPKTLQKTAALSLGSIGDILPSIIGTTMKAGRVISSMVGLPTSNRPEESAPMPVYEKTTGRVYPALFGVQLTRNNIPRSFRPFFANMQPGNLEL